jgi:hypothetical protein
LPFASLDVSGLPDLVGPRAIERIFLKGGQHVREDLDEIFVSFSKGLGQAIESCGRSNPECLGHPLC